MCDLIERLLNPPPLETHTIYASGGGIQAPVVGAYAVWFATMREAAAEIERLRANLPSDGDKTIGDFGQ